MNKILPLFCLVLATNAFAYVGPGVGISALGSLLALVAGLFLLLFGTVWYPIKRRLNKRPVKSATTEEGP
jgi:hypothetical protein